MADPNRTFTVVAEGRGAAVSPHAPPVSVPAEVRMNGVSSELRGYTVPPSTKTVLVPDGA